MNKELIGLKQYLSFVDQLAPHLDQVLISDAKEIDYGQWELPFEALLLAILRQTKHTIVFDFVLAKQLATKADIIDSGVLDIDTWERFERKFGALK